MTYIDGVPLSEFEALGNEMRDRLNKQAENSDFNENLLLGMHVVHEDGNTEFSFDYVGKDNRLHREFVPSVVSGKDIFDEMKKRDMFCSPYTLSGIVYEDRDNGFTVGMSDYCGGVKSGYHFKLMDDLVYASTGVKSELNTESLYSEYFHDHFADYVDTRHMIMGHEADIDSLSDEYLEILGESVRSFGDNHVDFSYTERNWFSDFRISITNNGNSSYVEMDGSYDKDTNEVNLSFDTFYKDHLERKNPYLTKEEMELPVSIHDTDSSPVLHAKSGAVMFNFLDKMNKVDSIVFNSFTYDSFRTYINSSLERVADKDFVNDFKSGNTKKELPVEIVYSDTFKKRGRGPNEHGV